MLLMVAEKKINYQAKSVLYPAARSLSVKVLISAERPGQLGTRLWYYHLQVQDDIIIPPLN